MKRWRSRSWRSASSARARHQAEVAGVARDRRSRQPVDHAVEGPRGGALEPAFAVARACACRRRRRSLRATSRRRPGCSSGGSWPSASRTIAASASTWSRPAVSASSLPKLRDSRSSATRGSAAAMPSRTVPGAVAAAVVHVQHAGVQRPARPAPPPGADAAGAARLFVVGGDDDGEAGFGFHGSMVPAGLLFPARPRCRRLRRRGRGQVGGAAQAAHLPLDPARAALHVAARAS